VTDLLTTIDASQVNFDIVSSWLSVCLFSLIWSNTWRQCAHSL